MLKYWMILVNCKILFNIYIVDINCTKNQILSFRNSREGKKYKERKTNCVLLGLLST